MTRRDGSTGWLGLVTMLGLAIALQPVPASAEQTTLVVFNVTNLVGSPSAGSFTIEVHPVRTDSPPARTHLPHTHTHTHTIAASLTMPAGHSGVGTEGCRSLLDACPDRLL